MNIDWNDFRVFTAVARTGSYTRAARELHIAQSKVSRSMARLEQHLGARLFDRGKKGADLTAEGRRLLNFANTAETTLLRGVQTIHDSTVQAVSECKVTMGDGLGTYWVPQFMQAFVHRYPNIGLKLFTSNEQATRTPLFDLQILYNTPMSDDVVPIQLGTLHFLVYGTREYLERHGTPETRDDLRHHQVIDQTFKLTDKGSLANWAGLHDAAVIRTNSSAAMMEMVRNSTGLAVLPTYASVIEPDLVPVMPQMNFSAPIFLCYEREAAMKLGVRNVIDFLKKHVFDPKTMPWFAMEYLPPAPDWSRIFAEQKHALMPAPNLKVATR